LDFLSASGNVINRSGVFNTKQPKHPGAAGPNAVFSPFALTIREGDVILSRVVSGPAIAFRLAWIFRKDSFMAEYSTDITDPHERQEEQQWARVLTAGNPVAGMILVFTQKFCTAVHEFGPAFDAGLIDDPSLSFYRNRLSMRLKKVLDVIRTNGVQDNLPTDMLESLLDKVSAAQSVAELGAMVEPVHTAGHAVCDALEQW